MRKVFPLIVVLITLSVLGIFFIQMSWIQNAVKLRQQQRAQDMEHAVTQIRESMYRLFLIKIGQVGYNDEESKQFYLKGFTTQKFTSDEISQIIERAVLKYNIKEPYEYVITNIFRMPISQSPGFDKEHYTKAKELTLTIDNNSYFFETLYLYVNDDKNTVMHSMGWYIAGSILFTTIILSAFALTIRTMFNQKKISEIKSDFINNMTHELKTPLATISLAIDSLTNEKVIHDTEKIKYYSSMIKDENKRMNKQVEKILQSARIEKQDVKLNLQELNAHQIISKVAQNLSLQIQEKEGQLNINLDAINHIVMADEVHFSNVVFNLLDNAIKYSNESPEITVSTKNNSNMLVVKVKDNGVGMNRETQARVFEKFYRAHTGNLHNVKGFGLGLSYVKAIVEAHGGKAKVESALGKGSTFSVYFPLANQA
ncbi:MAG: HAMP domain-containing sensor histidine kinase [Flavipsychrobacter sp.]